MVQRIPFCGALAFCVLLLALPARAETSTACPALPRDMLAATAKGNGDPAALDIRRVPMPAVGPGDVLVRVRNASVNPVDWKLQAAGRLASQGVPGGDFSGNVVARGAAVDGLACGTAVAGIVDQQSRSGSYAEYVSVPADQVVPKLANFSFAEAAAYPTTAVAAWRFLVATAAVQPGERVLVHGGAGGVGSLVVQLAKARGAHVIATASARNHDYLRRIGADDVVDYQTVRFEDAVKDVDVVVDTVGGETLQRSPAVLREGGRLVSMAGRTTPVMCRRIRCPATADWDVRKGMRYVEPLIAAGKLKVNIDRRYPLNEAAAAQQFNREGRTRGKVVLDVVAEVTP